MKTLQNSFAEPFRFHIRNASFAFKESWSNLANGLIGFMLFPLFMYILSKVWQKFNGSLGNYTYEEMLAYIGVTETLYLTFLRSGTINQASSDFSLSLARPRSWLMSQFSFMYGKTLGARLVMAALLFLVLNAFGLGSSRSFEVVERLLYFVIPLGIIEALYSLLFASANVRWEVTGYLTLPFSKLFLVFGGVFAPLSDFSTNSRDILLNFPPSDIFFQPAYYVIKGHFYELTLTSWSFRVFLQTLVLVTLNVWFFHASKKHHQSFGG